MIAEQEHREALEAIRKPALKPAQFDLPKLQELNGGAKIGVGGDMEKFFNDGRKEQPPSAPLPHGKM